MTHTPHKDLVHALLIVEHALLVLDLLSEEAADARNKHFRLYQQNFARCSMIFILLLRIITVIVILKEYVFHFFRLDFKILCSL